MINEINNIYEREFLKKNSLFLYFIGKYSIMFSIFKYKYINLNMTDIKEVTSYSNEPVIYGFLSFNSNYESKIFDWNDDGKRYKFFDFADKEIILKDKQRFRVFSNETNSWKYFRYYKERIDENNNLISPEYIKPIENFFTLERVFAIVAIIISIIALFT